MEGCFPFKQRDLFNFLYVKFLDVPDVVSLSEVCTVLRHLFLSNAGVQHDVETQKILYLQAKRKYISHVTKWYPGILKMIVK